jgi:hypothetical protein
LGDAKNYEIGPHLKTTQPSGSLCFLFGISRSGSFMESCMIGLECRLFSSIMIAEKKIRGYALLQTRISGKYVRPKRMLYGQWSRCKSARVNGSYELSSLIYLDCIPYYSY